jgi:hypothetical protein
MVLCGIFSSVNHSFSFSSPFMFSQALWRHYRRWIIKPPSKQHLARPKLTRCNDQHCLLSSKRIEHAHQSIRCGRCCGSFHLDAIFEIASYSTSSSTVAAGEYHSLLPYVVPPSKELLEQQSHDEWFCPLCLQEDTYNISHRYLHNKNKNKKQQQ